MKTVAIADLKSRLSHHLRTVRKGGALVVTDRGHPIARIVPMTVADGKGSPLAELIRAGLATPGKGPIPFRFCHPAKGAVDPTGSTLKALLDERYSGR